MSSIKRIIGLSRSLVIYHGIPFRQRRLRNFYSRLASPNELVFDLGAHAGNRTRAFAAIGCRVIALEPQPDFARLLRILFSRSTTVKIIESAASDKSGRAFLSISEETPTVTTIDANWQKVRGLEPGFSGVHWNKRIEIKTVTLDLLIQRFGVPAFIKIDVEGSEPNVLAGLNCAVRGLSFEYLPSALEHARKCISRLNSIAPYKFNWSYGESYRFAEKHWMTSSEISKALESSYAQRRAGDVYALLNVP